MLSLFVPIKYGCNIIITFIMWLVYMGSFVVLFFPGHLLNLLLIVAPKKREIVAQFLNYLHFKIFFTVLATITPGLRLCVSQEVQNLKSAIVVANHLSYLDSILMVSLFKKQKTIFKSTFFHVPFIGLIVKSAGFIPSSGAAYNKRIIDSINGLKSFLASGGVLFVFPEGTRSKTGEIGEFKEGAFKIARRCKWPLTVLKISNMEKLYPRDSFLLNTCVKNCVSVEVLGEVKPDYSNKEFSLNKLIEDVRSMYTCSPCRRDCSPCGRDIDVSPTGGTK